jgi:hypothetical protein
LKIKDTIQEVIGGDKLAIKGKVSAAKRSSLTMKRY